MRRPQRRLVEAHESGRGGSGSGAVVTGAAVDDVAVDDAAVTDAAVTDAAVTARTRTGAARILLALACLGALAGSAAAVRTRNLIADTYGSFRRAKAEGVALTDEGPVFPAPAAVRLSDPGVRTVWSLARMGDGRIALATGDQGKVLSVASTKTKDGTKELADLLDYELFAMTAGTKGRIYVSGAPTGSVTEINEDGKSKVLFRVPEQAVFALLAAPDGSVYAAAGDRGRLYRIPPDGDGKIVFESSDVSLRSLAWSKDGKIWAGSTGRGLVLSIDPESGKSRVVYDAAEEEIVSVVPLPSGGLVFGANPGNQGGGDANPGGSGASSDSGRDANSPPPDRDRDESPARPMVYLMSPSGSVRPIWRCPEKMLHSLALDADGNILAATGNDAAVYRITPDGKETALWQPEEDQVLSLLVDDRTIFAGTGSPGRLYRLGPGPSKEGTLTSDILDAKDQVTWGHLRFEGDAKKGELSFETRSGFTKDPDPSWSDWATVRDDAEGLMVQSPPARFLQWRAHLIPSGEYGPVLRRVAVAFAGVNAPPRISSLRVSPDEPAFTSDPGRGGLTQTLPGGIEVDYSLPPPGTNIVAVDEVPTWVRRIRSIAWDAQDPDNDDLEFKLEIRSAGESEWRVLADGIRDRAFTMDNGMLPDGLYEVRLTASDAPSNPPGTELSNSRLTSRFHIDTIAPTVTDVKAERKEGAIVLSGTARDESSAVRRIDASVDGGPFFWLTPADGLLDSPVEGFTGRVPLDKTQTGQWIIVRAQDEAGNRGSARVFLSVEK